MSFELIGLFKNVGLRGKLKEKPYVPLESAFSSIVGYIDCATGLFDEALMTKVDSMFLDLTRRLCEV